jgi:suppressor of G2 allele of SKP1
MQAKKDAGLQSAMTGGRSKETTNRNLALSWRINALTAMEKLEPGARGRKITVVKYPTPSETAPVRTTTMQTDKVTEIEDDDEPEEEADKPKIPQHILTGVAPSAPGSWTWDDVWDHFKAEHKKHDVRTDWYETDTAVNVSLFVKNVPKDSVKVDAREESVRPP